MSTKERQLLVVEDDAGLKSQLRWCFDNFEVNMSNDRQEAIASVRRSPPGVVLLDLGLPPDPGGVSEGMATLREIQTLSPSSRIIVVTGDHDRDHAVQAIAMGAYDFYQKPVDPEILTLMVDRAYRVYELEEENRRLQREIPSGPLKDIIGASPQIIKVCRTIEKVAPSNITTLLLGASGTGKEVFARALHNLSPRANENMVAINCAAIPENLLESELFGYEKGAFTGAVKQTQGKIEYAHGGTLFLDEIGDLPMELQAKLLRFLQERVVERVGGRQEIPVDVRIICATHQDLSSHIRDGRFREDLFYRISEITINIPTLSEREGDPLLLARTFLHRFSQQQGRNIRGFSEDALHAIESYAWPGNVRELESRIKRAVIMADNSHITAEDLEISADDVQKKPLNLKEIREEAERNAILRALNHANDNISETAKNLGVTRPTLYNMLEKYKLKA
jgi:two-component system, NtrC family, response regulator